MLTNRRDKKRKKTTEIIKKSESIFDELEDINETNVDKQTEKTASSSETREIDTEEEFEFSNLPSGSYTMEALRTALKKVETNRNTEISIYDDIQKIEDLYTYTHTPGELELTFVAKSDDNKTIEEVIEVTIEPANNIEPDTTEEKDTTEEQETTDKNETTDEEKTTDTDNPATNITIYGLFQSGSFTISKLKTALKKISANEDATVTFYAGNKQIDSIDTFTHDIGDFQLTIKATTPDGSVKDENIKITLTEQPLIVQVTSTHTRIWTDSGSGSDMDWSFHRPKPETGFAVLGDIAYWEHGMPARKTLTVKKDQTGVAKPIGYNKIWTDVGSDADSDVSIWTPVAPDGFTCLGDVAMGSHSSQPSTDLIRCIKNDFLLPSSDADRQVHDTGSDSDSDFSAWVSKKVTGGISHGAMVSHASYSRPGIARFKAIKDNKIEYTNNINLD